jgi:hypothetical protein
MTFQRIKFNIKNNSNIKISAWLNQQPISILEEFMLNLDCNNVIELQQDESDRHDFFYIKSVEFGRLNIVDLLHFGICKVVDPSGNKLADFVEDIGKTDRVIITINQDFYSLVIKHIDRISLL